MTCDKSSYQNGSQKSIPGSKYVLSITSKCYTVVAIWRDTVLSLRGKF